MKIAEILTLIFIFSLVGVVAGPVGSEKRRTEGMTETVSRWSLKVDTGITVADAQKWARLAGYRCKEVRL